MLNALNAVVKPSFAHVVKTGGSSMSVSITPGVKDRYPLMRTTVASAESALKKKGVMLLRPRNEREK